MYELTDKDHQISGDYSEVRDTYMYMKSTHTQDTHPPTRAYLTSTCIYAYNLFASIHRPTTHTWECPLGTRGHSKRTRVCDIFSLFSPTVRIEERPDPFIYQRIGEAGGSLAWAYEPCGSQAR